MPRGISYSTGQPYPKCTAPGCTTTAYTSELCWTHYTERPKHAGAQAMRAIPSVKRADASRANGKKGGRPVGSKNKPKPAS